MLPAFVADGQTARNMVEETCSTSWMQKFIYHLCDPKYLLTSAKIQGYLKIAVCVEQ